MEDEHRTAILNTYRHLRLAMIVIVVVLGVAVLLQRLEAGCWQTSVSAYYYTSVHAVFIAALCAVGACLIVYKGSSDTEDTVLNLAGFLAFVVAMMPTTRETICGGPSIPAAYDISPGAGNNVAAVLITGVIAEVVRLGLAYRANPDQRMSRPAKVSLFVGWVIIAVGTVGFLWDRRQFETHGHMVAAVTMFVGIVLIIVINAFSAWARRNALSAQARRHATLFAQLYVAVAAIMVLTLAVIVAIRLSRPDWEHVVIYVEVLLIATFALFWGIQTKELWGVVDRRELLPEGADPTGK